MNYLESLPRKKRILLLFLIMLLLYFILGFVYNLFSPALKVYLLFDRSVLQSLLQMTFSPFHIGLGLAVSFVLALFADSIIVSIKERKRKGTPLLAEKESVILGVFTLSLPLVVFIMFTLIWGEIEFSVEFILFTIIMVLVGIFYIIKRKFFGRWTKV